MGPVDVKSLVLENFNHSTRLGIALGWIMCVPWNADHFGIAAEVDVGFMRCESPSRIALKLAGFDVGLYVAFAHIIGPVGIQLVSTAMSGRCPFPSW